MKFKELSILLVFILGVRIEAAGNANNQQLETCEDEKGFKNLIKTRPNLLILFSRSGKANFFLIKKEAKIKYCFKIFRR